MAEVVALAVVWRWSVGRGRGIGWCRAVSWGRSVGRFRGVVGWLRCVVGRLGSVVGRLGCVVGRFWSMIRWAWWMISLLLWVVRCSLIGDLSNVTLFMVSSVMYMLCPTIRQGYRVGSNH